jgi:hypothetical protein
MSSSLLNPLKINEIYNSVDWKGKEKELHYSANVVSKAGWAEIIRDFKSDDSLVSITLWRVKR